MKYFLTMFLVGSLSLSAIGVAQNTVSSPTLVEALTLAYLQGPDLANAQTTLEDAQTNLTATNADPSSLVLSRTQAQQAYDLAKVQVPAVQLSVMQSVVNAYLSLYETQQNIALLQAQANLNAKSVQIAQAKLQAGSGTSLDVATAQNTLNTTQQNLANANALLGVQSSTLAKLFGQSSTQITTKAPPVPPTLKASLASLSQGLNNRLPSVVQAQHAVALQQLNVKLANNDYTPRLTLQAAQAKLQTTTRDLSNVQKSAANSVNDAHSTAQDAYQRIALQQKVVQNAQTTLTQAQTRYKSGVISQVELQTYEVSLRSAQYALTQAQDTYWKALAALSVAAATDVTGLVDAAIKAASADTSN